MDRRPADDIVLEALAKMGLRNSQISSVLEAHGYARSTAGSVITRLLKRKKITYTVDADDHTVYVLRKEESGD